MRRAISNQQSAIKNFFLHALAFAADQHAGHGVGGFARFRKRGIRAVPTGMVHVVAGRTAFAVAALAARGAVQDDLTRTGRPVFVDEEFQGFGSGSGWLGD